MRTHVESVPYSSRRNQAARNRPLRCLEGTAVHLALFSKSRFGRDAGTGRYRGSSSCATPGIAISVDASRHFWASFDSDRGLNAIGGALCTLLEEHGLPATWGLPEPLTSGLVSQLVAGQRAILSHEI